MGICWAILQSVICMKCDADRFVRSSVFMFRCEMSCPPGLYGMNCSETCGCSEYATDCDAENGRCSCSAGWTGFTCSLPCPQGKLS